MNEYLSNPVIAQFLGLIVGLFTSFFSWWILMRWLSPSITLSDNVSKTTTSIPLEEDDDKSGLRYRIKFENSGSRTIVDLQIQTYVRIKGLWKTSPNIWEVVHLPLNTNGEKIYSIPIIRPVRKSKLRTRLRICLNHFDYCTRPMFPDHIREKATQKTLILEDLMSCGTSTELIVVSSGYDEFTGTRKVFMKTYYASNIIYGEFSSNSLAIVEEVPN
ncbi:MAG: hypothetical protein WA666_07555 [Nitrospirota bacterium]